MIGTTVDTLTRRKQSVACLGEPPGSVRRGQGAISRFEDRTRLNRQGAVFDSYVACFIAAS